jgi:hypothetical protein
MTDPLAKAWSPCLFCGVRLSQAAKKKHNCWSNRGKEKQKQNESDEHITQDGKRKR